MSHPLAKPADVMDAVRTFWRDNVGCSGSEENGVNAPVVQAFRDAWSTVQKGGEGSTVFEAASRAVRKTGQWKSAHRGVVADIFESFADRPPSTSELDALIHNVDTDEVAKAVTNMLDSATGNHDGGGGGGSREMPRNATSSVDEEWLQKFSAAYGRDPYVHEYVLVRPRGGDLQKLAGTHKIAYERLRGVHAQYLDDQISEQRFVKTYVPRIYEMDDVPDTVRADALRRPEYRSAMETRLCSLHMVLCGRELSSKESCYLFDQDVLEKELPLDTDELHDIVSSFVRKGEDIRKRVENLIGIYLRRDAEQDEIDTWVFPFRTQEDAESNLRTQLIASHEFHSVLAETLKSKLPDTRQREVFQMLDRALAKADLASVESQYDLDEVLQKAGVIDASQK